MSLPPFLGNPSRLIRPATLGLALLVSGLSTGCSSSSVARLLKPSVDTDWQTASTYASAVSSMPPRSIAIAGHVAHTRECFGPCTLRNAAGHLRPSHRPM